MPSDTGSLSQTQTHPLAGVLDALPNAVVLLDGHLRVSVWNRAAERISGVRQTMAVGRTFQAIPHGLQGQEDMLRRALVENRRQISKRIPCIKGGRMCFTDIEALPVEAGSLLVLLRDSTAEVRTFQLLTEANKMLSIAGMAAGMAHEINNPLSGMLQHLQNVRRRLMDDLPANRKAADDAGLDLQALRRYLDLRGIPGALARARAAADRATRIVTDMLGFSHNGPADTEKVWVKELIDSVLRLLSADQELKERYAFHRIRILRQDAPPMATLQCNRVRIEQALFNLLRNAIQALKDRERPKIRIVSRLGGEHCEIDIIDNGPGVPTELQHRIFDPFFTTKATGEGIGLGLAICRYIVEDIHRGTLTLTSTPDKGTCFSLRLPLSPPIDPRAG